MDHEDFACQIGVTYLFTQFTHSHHFLSGKQINTTSSFKLHKPHMHNVRARI